MNKSVIFSIFLISLISTITSTSSKFSTTIFNKFYLNRLNTKNIECKTLNYAKNTTYKTFKAATKTNYRKLALAFLSISLGYGTKETINTPVSESKITTFLTNFLKPSIFLLGALGSPPYEIYEGSMENLVKKQ